MGPGTDHLQGRLRPGTGAFRNVTVPGRPGGGCVGCGTGRCPRPRAGGHASSQPSRPACFERAVTRRARPGLTENGKPQDCQEIARLAEPLGLVMRHVEAIEAKRDTAVRAGAAAGSAERADTTIAAPVGLKGIGANDATPLTHEIFCREFRNRRELAGWVGLTPLPCHRRGRRQAATPGRHPGPRRTGRRGDGELGPCHEGRTEARDRGSLSAVVTVRPRRRTGPRTWR